MISSSLTRQDPRQDLIPPHWTVGEVPCHHQTGQPGGRGYGDVDHSDGAAGTTCDYPTCCLCTTAGVPAGEADVQQLMLFLF